MKNFFTILFLMKFCFLCSADSSLATQRFLKGQQKKHLKNPYMAVFYTPEYEKLIKDSQYEIQPSSNKVLLFNEQESSSKKPRVIRYGSSHPKREDERQFQGDFIASDGWHLRSKELSSDQKKDLVNIVSWVDSNYAKTKILPKNQDAYQELLKAAKEVLRRNIEITSCNIVSYMQNKKNYDQVEGQPIIAAFFDFKCAKETLVTKGFGVSRLMMASELSREDFTKILNNNEELKQIIETELLNFTSEKIPAFGTNENPKKGSKKRTSVAITSMRSMFIEKIKEIVNNSTEYQQVEFPIETHIDRPVTPEISVFSEDHSTPGKNDALAGLLALSGQRMTPPVKRKAHSHDDDDFNRKRLSPLQLDFE